MADDDGVAFFEHMASGVYTRSDPRDLPEGWEECYDEDGDVYWQHTTLESTRSDPRQAVARG